MAGCTGDDGGSSFAEVDEVRVDASVAGTNSVRVKFTIPTSPHGVDSDGDSNIDSDAFGLTVFLPGGASYIEKTSKITDSVLGDVVFGNPDKREPDSRGSCKDGSSYLHYDFNAGDFEDPADLNDHGAFLKLQIQVTQAASGGTVSAADDVIGTFDRCGEIPDESAVVP